MCSEDTVPLPLAKAYSDHFIINTLPGLPITWLLGLGRLTPTRMSKHLVSEEQTWLIQWILPGYTIYGQPYSVNHKIAYPARISLKLTTWSKSCSENRNHTRLSPNRTRSPRCTRTSILSHFQGGWEDSNLPKSSNHSSLYLGQNLDSTSSTFEAVIR